MNRRLVFLVAAALLSGPLPGAADATGALAGRIEGERYVAPDGFYAVRLPVLPELGGEVHDGDGVVTFDDGTATHVSIACIPLDGAQRAELDYRGTKEYLTRLYTNLVLADFRQRFPGSSAENTIYVPDLLDGALLGFALLPGGSAFKESEPAEPGAAPLPAKRGNLLFVREDRVFVISLELAERVTQRKFFNKTPDEENAILRDRLVQFTGRLTFPAPAAGTTP